MFLAMTAAQVSAVQLARVTDLDMQPDYPVDFEPEYILYREVISLDYGFGGAYKYIDKKRPLAAEYYNSVEDFAMKIADDQYPALDPVGQAPEQAKRLDILVTRPCFIVLRLSPDEGGWTFAGTDTQAAVTLGSGGNGNPSLYGGLTYVTPTSFTRTRKAGCNVVFFAAMPQYGTIGVPYIQKMTYIIRNDDGYNNSMDPDVRHPGVGEP